MPQRKKILIVDDEPATRILLSQIFRQMGHDVAHAEDGIAALHEIRRTKPDILLSDLNMPVMSGFELLSVVRRRLPDIYVIATSGAYSGTGVPEGVAAEAFYEKASGLANLLQIVTGADMEGIAETRKTNPAVPVWVPADASHVTQSGYLPIACPECMRIFTYALPSGPGVVHQESCVDCHAQIHYAIVDVLAPVNEVVYHAALSAQLSGRHDGRHDAVAAA